MMDTSKLSQVRILVVDDHPSTATTLARAIAQMGPKIEVLSANSGENALMLTHNKPVDILITDMMMTGINGLELIEKLQTHPAGRPAYTILITAYDVPGLKITARRLKVNEIIIKPVRPERVCQIVASAIADLGGTLPAVLSDMKTQPKILVADDLPDNVALLSRYLVNEGYACLSAANGGEALLKTRTEMPDLVLLDMNMPVKDGFETLQEIRSDPAIGHIPVIILTAARLEPMDMQMALNMGADDYVTKPFDRRELLARIRTRLRVKEAEDIIRRRNKELNLLPEIGKELSARLDVDELTDVVLRRTVETLGAFQGHILLLEPDGYQRKTYRFAADEYSYQANLPDMTAALNQIRDTRQGVIIGDVRRDARWLAQPEDLTRSVVIVPMFGRFELLGLLVLAHEQGGYFLQEHMLLLQALASQAAIAIENARLFLSTKQEWQRLGAVLQCAADATLMFDLARNLSLFNIAAENLFAKSALRLGQPLTEGAGYDVFVDLLAEAANAEKHQSRDITWPDNRIFRVTITPLEGGYVASLHDISDFKRLERVKNEFIMTASHDLRSPITMVRGFSKLLSQVGPLNPDQQNFVRQIQSASETMDALVQSLFELTKGDLGEPLQLADVNLSKIAANAVQAFGSQVKAKQQRLTFVSQSAPIKVRGNELLLFRALGNLLGNAIKYSPQGGKISITAKVENKTVKIDVQDTGYGIPATDLPFIFDRFYRVRNGNTSQIEGNGLGLAIVKSIVENHGGQVSVESELGKGTCFSVTLPLVSTADPALAVPFL